MTTKPFHRRARNRTRSGASSTTSFRHGAVLVELAISMPLLFLAALAASDFGSVVHAYVVVTNAARAGATEGSMNNFTDFTRPNWEEEIRTVVTEEMAGLRAFDASRMDIAIDVTEEDQELFRVAVAVTYPFETIIAWPALPSSVELHYRSQMRRMR
jgi:Flp pilus assembly protein TadG